MAGLPMDVRFFETAAEFRAWLEANHATERELWLGMYKKASGKGGLTYREALDEALCFGWIDGLARSLGEEARAQRWTPRRKRSSWSNVNVSRYRELEAEGRVAPAGRAAFEIGTAEDAGIRTFEQARAAYGTDFEERLRAQPEAWAYWEARSPGYRRLATGWVVSARRPETRERRFGELVRSCIAGERIPPLRG